MLNYRKISVWVAVIVLLAAAGLGIRTWQRRTAATATPSLMTVRVGRGNLDVRVTGTGAVEAAVREEIRASISGTIARSVMSDGLDVVSGQLLLELDFADQSLQIEKALLDLEIQERNLAKLRQEETFSRVAAPENGEVAWKIREGERVQEGSLIATIQNRSIMRVTGRFNATQVKEIRTGQQAEFRLLDSLVTLPGKVVLVSGAPRPGGAGSILYDVVVEINNPGGLETGMSGVLTIGEHYAIDKATTSLPELIQLRAPITGKAAVLLIADGQVAAKGQVLAELSDPDRAGQLEGQIATAQLKLRQAKLDLEDKKRQQQDKVTASKIVSPITGTLVLAPAVKKTGDDITPAILLATVVDYSRLQVVIPVDELDVAKIKPGQQVRLTAEALPGRQFAGEVSHIAREGKSQNGVATFDVTVAITPVDGLLAGMSVNADILTDSRQGVLLVPIEAVQVQNGRSFVVLAQTAGQEGQGGARRLTPVETGARDANFMEIVSGLAEGQEIVIGGTNGTAAARQGGFGSNMRAPGMMVPGGRTWGGSGR